MSDELTKRLTAHGPVAERRARGGFDDLVHLVVAAPLDLIDPSVLRTRCGRPVLEVYTDDRTVTCSKCESAEAATASDPLRGQRG